MVKCTVRVYLRRTFVDGEIVIVRFVFVLLRKCTLDET